MTANHCLLAIFAILWSVAVAKTPSPTHCSPGACHGRPLLTQGDVDKFHCVHHVLCCCVSHVTNHLTSVEDILVFSPASNDVARPAETQGDTGDPTTA
uniref:Secreted protein n=1 Tax=Denticeps clupeoides TaxID=299321 RepID=A0AAY3ZWP4_9TELE